VTLVTNVYRCRQCRTEQSVTFWQGLGDIANRVIARDRVIRKPPNCVRDSLADRVPLGRRREAGGPAFLGANHLIC